MYLTGLASPQARVVVISSLEFSLRLNPWSVPLQPTWSELFISVQDLKLIKDYHIEHYMSCDFAS
jgi:hypothetical protein